MSQFLPFKGQAQVVGFLELESDAVVDWASAVSREDLFSASLREAIPSQIRSSAASQKIKKVHFVVIVELSRRVMILA